MCGLVGIIQDGPIDERDVVRARDAIAHRGPDDAGIWLTADRRVALAHRRLSILDLSAAGHQPFRDADAGVALVYNGEVYNFAALRAELEGLGHVFRSASDTEVVLRAYLAWGTRCVERLRGMFAFALWDAREERLVLARDRLGIKPLYYYDDGSRFAFASELKAIVALPGLDLRVDESALYDFLTYLYVPAPKSAYARVRKLQPGHVLVRERGGALRVQRYWDVDFGTRTGVAPRDAVRETRERLEECVRAHLVADVPVGSLLSGGVDSSAVTALAQRALAEPIRTFAVGFDVATHSETGFARMVAAHVGTRHREVLATVPRGADVLGLLAASYDEPFADTSAVPTREVCRVAREDVTVALSGDGGDEVFGGYTSYARHARRARLRFLSRALRGAVPALEVSPLRRVRGVATLIDAARDPIERHVVIQGGLTKAQKARVLPADVARRFRDYDDYWHFRAYWRDDLDLVARLQYLDLKTYLPDDVLTKVDRASMAFGLELRPPILDHTLVEYVASLPTEVRTPRGELKHLLKRAVEDALPAAIIARPKKGFGVPLAWVDGWGAGGGAPTPLGAFAVALLARWREGAAGRGAEAPARADVAPGVAAP